MQGFEKEKFMASLKTRLPSANVRLKTTTPVQRQEYLELSQSLPRQSRLPALGSGALYNGPRNENTF